MVLARSRSLFLLGFLASAGVLGAAYFLQYRVGLVPCSLCLVQRFFIAALAVSCLAGFLHRPALRGVYGYLMANTLFIAGAVAAALRQLWLQANGEQPKVACQPGLDYLLATLPFPEALKTLLLGTPECARVNWTLLDMSVPEWSLLALAGLLLLTLLGWLHALRPRAGNLS
ncbi:disulfide bond formation protein [Pseudomonas sp. M47T1]|uniref:disulfide bond formation protein B n=1 Tax=unclassified Pseudomonas TaxID=196821 RepID=UPI0002607220|nr:disulfide bond formation protein B [Pseudomonas sp. M47T1]EIK97273.1 disulfide bond formation protein [Pseudomonas sp. M47T1]